MIARRACVGWVWALAWLTLWSSAARSSEVDGGRRRERASTASLTTGQTLEDLARELWGDDRAAEELRALNDLPVGSNPPPGRRFQLPGREREAAVTALVLASQSVEQARVEEAQAYAADRLRMAEVALEKARQAQRKANYSACQGLSDEAWSLARLARQEALTRRAQKNRFSVAVDKQGNTRVAVDSGEGVKVWAGEQTVFVDKGFGVNVTKGAPPGRTVALLPAPDPGLPAESATLVTSTVLFRWGELEGVGRYLLLISRDPFGRDPVYQIAVEGVSHLLRGDLADGVYYWFIRGVDAGGLVGKASSARRFVVKINEASQFQVEPRSAPAASEKGP